MITLHFHLQLQYNMTFTYISLIGNGNRTEWSTIQGVMGQVIIVINARWSHYLFSDWRKAYSEFLKSAPGASDSDIQ